MTRPTAMAPDASTSPVDWSRPIEAVHEDGRVMAVTGIHDWSNDQWPHSGVADHEHIFMRDDGRCSRATWGDMPGWRIRNVQPTTPERDPALWDRMEAFIRRCDHFSSSDGFVGKADHIVDAELAAEARAIVADLPKPVDPDLIEAREIAAGLSKPNAYISFSAGERSARLIREGCMDDGLLVTGLLAAIKRGRELAAPEVSHVG